MRRSGAAALLITVAVLAAWKLVPFMAATAPAVEATPVPPPIAAGKTLALRPGSEACVNRVVFSENARYVQMASVDREGRERPELVVTAEAPGYSSGSTVPAGPPGRFTARLTPPAGERPDGRVCVRNTGRTTTRLEALPPAAYTAEGKPFYLIRSRTTLNGKPSDYSISVTLLRSTDASRLSNLPYAVANSARLPPVVPAFVWLLIALLVVGAPLALAAAVGLAAGRKGDDPPLTESGRHPAARSSTPEAR